MLSISIEMEGGSLISVRMKLEKLDLNTNKKIIINDNTLNRSLICIRMLN